MVGEFTSLRNVTPDSTTTSPDRMVSAGELPLKITCPPAPEMTTRVPAGGDRLMPLYVPAPRSMTIWITGPDGMT